MWKEEVVRVPRPTTGRDVPSAVCTTEDKWEDDNDDK
jgi:hypothetical protein